VYVAFTEIDCINIRFEHDTYYGATFDDFFWCDVELNIWMQQDAGCGAQLGCDWSARGGVPPAEPAPRECRAGSSTSPTARTEACLSIARGLVQAAA
jgi:hypothetical protein